MTTLALCACLVGCSSGDSTEPLPEEEPGELLRYDAIAGPWSGWGYEAVYSFQASIAEDGHVGEQVGTFNVLRVSEGRLVPYCATPLEATSAHAPTYVFDGSAGSCTPVTITFVHDPVEDRIEIANSNGETGYLIPGSDPGQPPE